jgi:hypothetical protein
MKRFDKLRIADFLMSHTDEFVEWYKLSWENGSVADQIPDKVAKRALSDAVSALHSAAIEEAIEFCSKAKSGVDSKVDFLNALGFEIPPPSLDGSLRVLEAKRMAKERDERIAVIENEIKYTDPKDREVCLYNCP